MNHFDQASRFAAKLEPVEFIRWLLNLPVDAFAFRESLDTRDVPFPGAPDRTSDTVAHLEDFARGGVPWVLAIEFQSQPDPKMGARLLGYIAGLLLNYKPDEERGSRFLPGAAVVNLTGKGLTSFESRWKEAGLELTFQIQERNLESESATDLLVGIEAGRWSRCMLPWIPLMSGGDNTDTIDKWKILAEADPNRRRKAEYAGLALVFADKAGCREILEQKLEGWNVEESSVVNAWIAKGEKRGIAIGEARGKELGKELGMELGMELGGVEESRATILRLGAKKFGAAPEGIEVVVKAIQDRARLERIIDHILDATGWGDLLATP